MTSSNSATMSIKSRESDSYKALDADGILILRVTDTSAQKLYIKSVKDGQETEFIYDLSGLTLEPES